MILLYIAAALIALGALWTEFARTLMMLQQNSYRPERYRRYLASSGESTSYSNLIALVIFFASLITAVPMWLSAAVQALYFAITGISELRRKYKKPLARTPRVNRLTAVMWALFVVVCAIFGPWQSPVGMLWTISTIAMGARAMSPLFALMAVWLLKPVEKAINQRYIGEAERILASMPGLKVIGITGSYGKTSTKHYLQRILSEQFSVCMTPGSFNTTMGVVRTIREYLRPYDTIFICEMGAKQPGDISEICRLVHPSVGIVTAVGPQHLESFKTLENVQRTKFELVDALPADGLAVINNDFPMIASRRVSGVDTVRYAVSATTQADVVARDIVVSPSGTDFTVDTPKGELRLHTSLLGECNISNLTAAVVVALRLGMNRDAIRYAVEKIEPVEHRLSVKRLAGNVTILDDAFNSNPAGSAMALDVLRAMSSSLRVVVTPGMIELGNEQYELNRQFGENIARSADVAIVVGQYNREAILEGIASASGVKVYTVDAFKDVAPLMATIATSNYTILYENDLPDTFK